MAGIRAVSRYGTKIKAERWTSVSDDYVTIKMDGQSSIKTAVIETADAREFTFGLCQMLGIEVVVETQKVNVWKMREVA